MHLRPEDEGNAPPTLPRSIHLNSLSFRRKIAHMQNEKGMDHASFEQGQSGYGGGGDNRNIQTLFQLMSDPSQQSSLLPSDRSFSIQSGVQGTNVVTQSGSSSSSNSLNHGGLMSMLVFKPERQEDQSKLRSLWREHGGHLPSRAKLRQAAQATGLSQSRIRRFFLEEATPKPVMAPITRGEPSMSQRLDEMSRRLRAMEQAMEDSRAEMQQLEIAVAQMIQMMQSNGP